MYGAFRKSHQQFLRLPGATMLAVVLVLSLIIPAAGQSVGPSGCVANCGSGGGSSSGDGYNPYAGAAATAFSAFMQGFMGSARQANDPRHRARSYNEKANEYYKNEDYANAVRYYEAALKLNPNSSVIQRNLANALNQQAQRYYWDNDFPSQITALERAVQLAPSDDIIQGNLDMARRLYLEHLEIERQMAAAGSRVSTILTEITDQAEVQDLGISGLAMIDFNDPILAETDKLADERKIVSTRLGGIENKILNAEAGASAWDGGYGGTLDSPEAGNVPGDPIPVPVGQTGTPLYAAAPTPEVAALDPSTHTGSQPIGQDAGLRPLGAAVSATKKVKDAKAAVSIAASLANREDYDGAIKYLEQARIDQPNRAGLVETLAYVQGLKTATSPKIAARLANSSSPKAEIILDSLQVGQGNWDASIRYLEALRYKRQDDRHVAEALSYVKGVAIYQKVRGNADPAGGAALPKPAPFRPDPSLDHLLGAEPRPNPDEILDATFFEMLGGEPLPPRRGAADDMIDNEIESMLEGFKDEDIRKRGSLGLDAVGRDDFDRAARIFGDLYAEYPNDPNIRDTFNYVAGLRDAKAKSQ